MFDDDGGEALLNRIWRGASCFPTLIPVVAFVLATGGAATARPGAAAGPMSVPGPPPFLPAVHVPPPPVPTVPIPPAPTILTHTPGTPPVSNNPHIPADKAQGALNADA